MTLQQAGGSAQKILDLKVVITSSMRPSRNLVIIVIKTWRESSFIYSIGGNQGKTRLWGMWSGHVMCYG